ncbi:hypothetical protein GWK48_03290 [Metallosphaera tengchongensis]|uniref:Uncharacterized protein n=1 Tax=Metallosphaera tengchongensis TaxID=1532350 RepID=A0A6N0NTU5_9CREN|nr:hypothetical protein [Metallosphaera tengchongensis]QKQ99546.1 hypothetical protein GWK48_03290 [Metallosphaera tengchongensis]
MKVVKYEVEGKLEKNGKTTTFKRKYRHLKFAKEYVRSLTEGECKWTEENDKIRIQCSSQSSTYEFEIRKNRIVKPKKQEPKKEEKAEKKDEQKQTQNAQNVEEKGQT